LSRDNDSSPTSGKYSKTHNVNKSESYGKASWRRNIGLKSRNPSSISRHLHRLATGDHQRHGSLSKLYSRRSSCDLLSDKDVEEDEGSHDELERDGSVSTAGRRTSITTDLMGSIRGLGRRAISLNLVTSISNRSSPTKHSVDIPLPSSPIDIPQAAPLLALRLDLGPAAFLSDDFASPSKVDCKSHFGNDPFHGTSSSNSEGIDNLSGASKNLLPTQPRVARPVTPGELLSLPTELFDFVSPMLESPMPGTTLGLELEDREFDDGKVFERTIESSPVKEGKNAHGLRSMSSLDALAKACFNDDDLKFPALSISERNFFTSPFIASDPTSLPREFKRSEQDSAEIVSLIPDDKAFSSGASAIFRQDSATVSNKYQAVANQQSRKPSCTSCSQMSGHQGKSSSDDGLRGGSSDEGEHVLVTGEYEHLKTAYIFGDTCLEQSPVYDCDRDHTPPISISLTHRPSTASLSKQMFQRISRSNSTSPRSIRAGTTHRADVGDIFWASEMLDRQAGLMHHADTGVEQLDQDMSDESHDTDQQSGTAGHEEKASSSNDIHIAEECSLLLPFERALFANPLPLRLKNRQVSATRSDIIGTKPKSSRFSEDVEDDVFADAYASEFDRPSDDLSCLGSRCISHQHEVHPYPPVM
jgi:hypothetical protein